MRWLVVVVFAAGCNCGGPVIPGPEDLDSGTVDAGRPLIDYCGEVRPIMQLSCVGTCHGEQMQFPNSPADFRLDYYAPSDGGLPGVKAKADRVRDRIFVKRDHPPSDFPIHPATADRKLVSDWVLQGALRGDGGCEP